MMNKVDYNKLMLNQINMLSTKKPSLLLHACCAPCSSSVLERLVQFFNVTILYYNPNTFPQTEFEKRRDELCRLNQIYDGKINLVCLPYNHSEFLEEVKGLEACEEGEDRCKVCYKLRLQKTFDYAREREYDYFCTTLSVSPHKNSNWINSIGEELSKNMSCPKWLNSDFKKQNGYLRSIELTKKFGFYRQNYCGCEFSIKNSQN